MTSSAAPNGPLKGLKIVDLTSVVFGPYSTQILSDLGADVIKVESPAGDIMRFVGKHGDKGMGPVHLNVNRGKKVITLDLKKPDALAVLHDLIREADVFAHTMRPAAAARLKIGYDDLREINPSLIYAGAYGFAADGPYAAKPAYDDIIQGLSGFAALNAHLVGEPRFVPNVINDKICSLVLTYSILAAAYHRQATGEGQAIEVPMFESSVQFLLVEHLGDRTFGKDEPPGYARVLSQLRKPHKTQDGYLCVLPYHDKNWADFFRIVDRPDLIEDARFSSHAARSANYEVLYSMLSDFIAERPSAFWLETLAEHNIPVAKVQDLEDLFEDEHLNAVNFFTEVDHPDSGKILATRQSVSFSATPPRIGGPAGRMGAHTVEVLKGLGYDDEKIGRLLDDGSVRQAD
ncbi:CaiB/BaiF CoA transferase family protein [Pseudooceanicola sp.]|jgi:crotonobetainyl-CoA:carnitine CoA-transferase CaiB-like acyl-CoA transferase|uniref:CaiB/BaiF CoA transferase family protein n=1 Tax=Pseudooceanicola sp. TaxID=1914328 RepID=UPI004058B16E